MNERGAVRGERPVEERLRAALCARAGSVGLADLRPAVPPSASGAARAGFAARRAALALFVLAAAVACVLFLVSRGEEDRPARPAGEPSATYEDTPVPTKKPSPLPTAGGTQTPTGFPGGR